MKTTKQKITNRNMIRLFAILLIGIALAALLPGCMYARPVGDGIIGFGIGHAEKDGWSINTSPFAGVEFRK